MTLYICDDPWQGVVFPEIDPGCRGKVVTVTANTAAGPLPQALEGTTWIFPEIDPTVTVTELLVPPPVCAQSAGKAQVYIIPLMFVTL